MYLTGEDGSRAPVGELVMEVPNGRGYFRASFRYTSAYLRDPSAFPLDPRSLPLEAPSFDSDTLEPPLSVFRDALPDSWGRRVMIARYSLTGTDQNEPTLLRLLGARGLGALAFFEIGTRSDLPSDESTDLTEVTQLVDAAARFERGAPVDKSMAQLFRAGGSPGGMRPKALFQDADGHWIGKFPAAEDRDDVVGLEAATLELARSAHLKVPKTRLLKLAGSRKVLLVKRFDITPLGGRHHVLSLSSLLRESRIHFVLDYEDAFEAIVRYSAAPEEDLVAFYRHMVFNAAIGNTDDHLKNWAFLHTQEGFRLAPAFDLVPDTGRRHEHTLRFNGSNYPPSRESLIVIANRFHIGNAKRILEEVCDAVAGFKDEAQKANVPVQQIRHYAEDIGQRLSQLSG